MYPGVLVWNYHYLARCASLLLLMKYIVKMMHRNLANLKHLLIKFCLTWTPLCCCSFTLSSIRIPSLVSGSVLMLKYPASLPLTKSNSTCQFSLSLSRSSVLSLITSTPYVFSCMLASYYRWNKRKMSKYCSATPGRVSVNKILMNTVPSCVNSGAYLLFCQSWGVVIDI